MTITPSAMPRSVVAVAIGILLTGCAAATGDVPAAGDEPRPPASDPDPAVGVDDGAGIATPPDDVPTFDWSDLDAEAALADGWLLRDCDGDAPLRCLHGPDGQVRGTVELLRFPDDDRLDGEGDAIAELQTIVAELETWLAEDRAEGCPGHTLTLDPRIVTAVAGAPAVVRGHALRDADGLVVERSLVVYVADGGDLVLVVVNATDPGGCGHQGELIELTPDELDLLRTDLVALVERGTIPTG
jgi:hypothetical protein